MLRLGDTGRGFASTRRVQLIKVRAELTSLLVNTESIRRVVEDVSVISTETLREQVKALQSAESACYQNEEEHASHLADAELLKDAIRKCEFQSERLQRECHSAIQAIIEALSAAQLESIRLLLIEAEIITYMLSLSRRGLIGPRKKELNSFFSEVQFLSKIQGMLSSLKSYNCGLSDLNRKFQNIFKRLDPKVPQEHHRNRLNEAPRLKRHANGWQEFSKSDGKVQNTESIDMEARDGPNERYGDKQAKVARFIQIPVQRSDSLLSFHSYQSLDDAHMAADA